MVLPEALAWCRPASESFPRESPTPGVSQHLSPRHPGPGIPPHLGPAQTVQPMLAMLMTEVPSSRIFESQLLPQ